MFYPPVPLCPYHALPCISIKPCISFLITITIPPQRAAHPYGLIEPFGTSSIQHLRQRDQQHSRTRRLARSVGRVAREDGSGSRSTERGAPREARGRVTSHNNAGAASLADGVADGTGGGRGGEDEDGEGRGYKVDEELHGGEA
jgi:hypothetical protein